MSKLYSEIRSLIELGKLKISEHRYDELDDDNISFQELLNSISNADIVEEYPDYPKGKCILLLTRDREKHPIHSVWGIPKGYESPAVLITAYRPDSSKWDQSYKKRR